MMHMAPDTYLHLEWTFREDGVCRAIKSVVNFVHAATIKVVCYGTSVQYQTTHINIIVPGTIEKSVVRRKHEFP